MKTTPKTILIACSFALILAGCATYYKVTDPTSGRVYYTQKVKKHEGTGGVTFKDAGTGGEITLQSSEILTINRDEFKEGTAKK